MNAIDRLIGLFATRGNAEYHGEAVSQSEHALQAAALADSEGAPAPLVVAALLHDVGHLLHNLPEDAAEQGIDDRHEALGAAWLAKHFAPEVAEPVRLHVSAKRYLCAVDPSYLEGLSPSSRQSLSLQGGPMDASEVADFSTNPHHAAAVRLRIWDDRAKVPGLGVPGVEHYRDLLTLALLPDRGADG
jgi:[1-hydroxy-2-(trimethylamino)ethyl]phosphonate dioxygenase